MQRRRSMAKAPCWPNRGLGARSSTAFAAELGRGSRDRRTGARSCRLRAAGRVRGGSGRATPRTKPTRRGVSGRAPRRAAGADPPPRSRRAAGARHRVSRFPGLRALVRARVAGCGRGGGRPDHRHRTRAALRRSPRFASRRDGVQARRRAALPRRRRDRRRAGAVPEVRRKRFLGGDRSARVEPRVDELRAIDEITPRAREDVRGRSATLVHSPDFPQGPRHEGGRGAAELAAAYDSASSIGPRRRLPPRAGRLTVHLAREFGFCYGVDRAVDYAYQARRRFPDRNVFLTGEIIHNPHVNDRLRAAGIRFLTDPGEERSTVSAPTTSSSCRRSASRSATWPVRGQGCTLVDTTCGSVLNVWKNVVALRAGWLHRDHPRQGEARRDARDRVAGAEVPRRPLPRRARSRRGAIVCDYIRAGGDRDAFLERFAARSRRLRPGSRPGAHRLRQPDDDADVRVARDRARCSARRCARATARRRCRPLPRVRHDLQRHAGAAGRGHRAARRTPLDLMMVVGGYNSSNTCNLARICGRAGADVPHRRYVVSGVRSPNPPSSCRRSPSTGSASEVSTPAGCRSRPGHDRSDRWRVDAEQHHRRGGARLDQLANPATALATLEAAVTGSSAIVMWTRRAGRGDSR